MENVRINTPTILYPSDSECLKDENKDAVIKEGYKTNDIYKVTETKSARIP